jgi:hypothetical protein
MTVTAERHLAEILPYRPRAGAAKRTPDPADRADPVDPAPERSPERCFVIHFAGQDFVTRQSMAEMFLRKSGRVAIDGTPQLVPLLHEDGLDLLLVTSSTVVTVTEA